MQLTYSPSAFRMSRCHVCMHGAAVPFIFIYLIFIYAPFWWEPSTGAAFFLPSRESTLERIQMPAQNTLPLSLQYIYNSVHILADDDDDMVIHRYSVRRARNLLNIFFFCSSKTVCTHSRTLTTICQKKSAPVISHPLTPAVLPLFTQSWALSFSHEKLTRWFVIQISFHTLERRNLLRIRPDTRTLS